MPRLTHCPENGTSLDGISCRKRALTLWPQLDPSNLPKTEAGRRYQLLMDEHAARERDTEDANAAARAAAKHRTTRTEA
jgi:hypothetical protein